MKGFASFEMLVFLLICVLCGCAVGKECTNTPTQLSSHTYRFELLSSENETWKEEMFSHYHLIPTDDSAWSNLLPRKVLREADENSWSVMYRKMKNQGGFKLSGDFLKELSLHDVRLDADSMHGRAQQTNLEYLLLLDVDRLVWSFRKTAGLPTPGKAYKGWEDPTCELRGHFVGHYLSASALMWVSTYNDTLKQKMTALVSALSECQQEMGTGYLSAFPSEQFDRFEAIKPVWAPYYTIHKILAGLLDQYTFARNAQALKMMTWMVEYFYNRVQNVIMKYSVERHYLSLNEETGGMNDVLYKLYSITEDPKHLLLAHLFDKPCFLGILAVEADDISGFHANTHIPIVIGSQMRYEVTGDPLYKAMAAFFMEIVNSSHSYATGGTSVSEFWSDPKRLASTLQAENEESCTTYNMLKVSRHLFTWTKEMAYADYYERALTNGVLGIHVCSKNLGDEQLAIVISQLVEERGGPLQHHLKAKFLLPSSIEKRDYWLASLLEWEMGNYLQSFFSMLGFQINTMAEKSVFSSKHVAFLEPNIGLYCQMLASKNSLRNAVGEQNTAVLSRWATLMTSTALKRCGLPLEALECLSSSMSVIGSRDDGRWSDDVSSFEILNGILKPSPQDSSNWLSGDAAFQLESHDKLDLALPYFSKLLIEHPSWPGNIVESVGASACSKEYEIHEYEELLENFRHKFFRGLSQFDQRFSLTPAHVVSLMFVSLCNHGLLFMGYDILDGSASQDQSQDKHYKVDSFILYPLLRMPLLKATNEISLLFSRFITACSITCPQTKLHNIDHDMSANNRSKWLDTWGYFFQGLMPSLLSLRAALRFISSSITKDLMMEPLMILDLFEFYVHFASAWLQKNSKVLLLMVQPLLITLMNGHAPYEADVTNMRKLLPQIEELVAHNISMDDRGKGLQASNCVQNKLARDMIHSMPEEERWQIIGTCLWQHMSSFVKQKFEKLDDKCLPGVSIRKLSSYASYYTNLEYDGNNITEEIRLVSLSLAELLKTTLTHLSSYHVKQLASFIQQKVENGLQVMTLLWLKESSQLQSRDLCEGTVNIEVMKSKDESSISELLWDICADSKIIYEGFKHGKVNLSHSFDQKLSNAWSDKYIGLEVHEREGSNTYDGMLRNSSASSESESPAGGLIHSGPAFPSSWQKEATLTKEVISFKNPKEVYKRSGELLEALCVNSIDQRQAVLASNRKGILFFNWEDGSTFTDQSDYIWSIADWPQNGWAGSESTPVPTCVSPGVGLGSERGAHLGLGGATVGVGSLVRPGRDLTGGGAFGIPGYAGMGASGLGWEIQQDFEEFVDAPPTVENISTRAFSGHPSRQFFLVGSSNTHIYLWEFGKDKATATYGVLPAANVPPPYALASISALRFDYCGHRFATAALDGTVCTWQLEVGGRSNICPTESSLCFNNHASDVTYVSGGSVIAAAGNSSNGVNVVIWDTLAPPSTSRASIICHEGGARSLAVFDNDIGSGSISPLIVTGGKGGDVGLHDFRYIATGKSKRNRHADIGESIGSSSSSDIQTGITKNVGDQNRNGMLWYIPKAHSGSITKICTIPNTSLFLTGSKDGDVKLWDAKRAKLVYHWSKLHERHTFLQPSSRGFGGLVRAAVTDIQVLSHGFLTCGGDGIVKLVELKQ